MRLPLIGTPSPASARNHVLDQCLGESAPLVLFSVGQAQPSSPSPVRALMVDATGRSPHVFSDPVRQIFAHTVLRHSKCAGSTQGFGRSLGRTREVATEAIQLSFCCAQSYRPLPFWVTASSWRLSAYSRAGSVFAMPSLRSSTAADEHASANHDREVKWITRACS
jgi:hypothetical protein